MNSATDRTGRVLVVSFRFPPHGGGGVHRVAAFTKYLPRFGWRPHVLTGPLKEVGSRHDPSLLGKIPEEVAITRSEYLSTRTAAKVLKRLRLLWAAQAVTPSFPMMDGGWIPAGYRAGLELVRREDFDLIYSSAYPMSSHLVAYLLKRKTGLPWVADYRDEWSLRPGLPWPTDVHWSAASRIDRLVTESADRVVTTSPAHTENFRRAFPCRGPDKYGTITNGFDEEDFQAEPAPGTGLPRPERFTLAHVGLFNGWRDAGGLRAAVRRLIEQERIPAEKIELLFVGPNVGLSDPWLEAKGVLRQVDPVPHGEAVQTMRASDMLLLLNVEWHNILGKTFEYLASRRPILALMPEGATADVVREAGAGEVLPPEDVDRIARAIERDFVLWSEGRLEGTASDSVVRRYSRRETTGELASLFAEVAALSMNGTQATYRGDAAHLEGS